MLGLSNEVSKVHFGPGASKLQDSKFGGQKKLETFWVRGYVLYSSAPENTRENH